VFVYLAMALAFAIKVKTHGIVKTLLHQSRGVEAGRGSGARQSSASGASSGFARLLEPAHGGHGGGGHGGSDDEDVLHSDDEAMDTDHSVDAEERRKHKALFWGGKTVYVRRLVQLITLLEAILIPVHINYFYAQWHHMKKNEQIALHFFAIVPHFITCMVALPSILPNYVFASCVGTLARPKFIRDALLKTPSIMAMSPELKVEGDKHAKHGGHAKPGAKHGAKPGGGDAHGHGSSSGGGNKSGAAAAHAHV
jgi:hypothetical protein